jgi:PKD repeat protein
MFGNASMQRLFTLMPLEPQFRKAVECDWTFTVVPDTRTVCFRDKSYGPVTSWHWDFGDGTTSTEQNPVHTYSRDFAHYVVTLNVEGPKGSARCCKVWEVCVRDTSHPSGTSYD